jgi:hypothetical protein
VRSLGRVTQTFGAGQDQRKGRPNPTPPVVALAASSRNPVADVEFAHAIQERDVK